MGWLTVIVVHLVLLNVVCSENADFDAVSRENFSNVDVTLYYNYCIKMKKELQIAESIFILQKKTVRAIFGQDVVHISYRYSKF